MTSALNTGSTEYELRGETQLVATRNFNAPSQVVFDAFTVPAHVSRWLTGPAGWTMPVCDIDLRAGGKWRYLYRSADGANEFAMHGEYESLHPPSRVAFTERFGDNPTPTHNSVEFVTHGSLTTMIMTITYKDAAMREMVMKTGMTSGMDTSFNRLDAQLVLA